MTGVEGEAPHWAETLRRAIAKEEQDLRHERPVLRAARPPRAVTRSELFGLRALRERHEGRSAPSSAPR